MNGKIKVSIIIPVFRVREYIVKCLESIVNQTVSCDIECIIIDDCTPDDSIEKTHNFVKEYDGDISFRFLQRKTNGGLSAARNSGIKVAQGEYLYFLDSDDYILPGTLEKLVAVADKYPKAQIVQAGAIATNGGFSYLRMTGKKIKDYSEDHPYIRKKMLGNYYPATAWNKLIKREWLLQNNLFFKEGLLHEDDYWNFFASKYVSAYAVCRFDGYVYNIRSNSITTAPNDRNVRSWIVSATDFMNSLDDDCLSAQIAMLYKSLTSQYIRIDDAFRQEYYGLFKTLKSHCGIVGNLAILFFLHTPLRLLKTSLFKIINQKIMPKVI